MDRRNHKIENASVICAILVVLIHVTKGCPLTASFSVRLWLNLFHDGICRIAVPWFFCVAGYLLARKMGDPDWWRKEVGKRIGSLVVPFVTLNSAFILYSLLFLGLEISTMRNLCVLIGLHYEAPCLGPLWFVRSLFLFVVVSPILEYLSRDNYRAILSMVVLFTAYVLIAPFDHYAQGHRKIFTTFFSLSGLFYFFVGICLRRRWASRTEFSGTIYGGLATFLLFLLIIIRTAMVMNGSYYLPNYLFVGIIPVGLFWLWRLVPERKWPAWLVNTSFPIYLLHMFVIVGIRRILVEWGGGCVWNQSVMWQIGISFIAIMLSIVVASGLRRVPMVGRVCFGGR